MTRYRFELAKPDDDRALRSLLARTPMPGEITLAFQREPSFFRAHQVLGREHQTMVCRAHDTGDVVGVAVRSVRSLFVDGRPMRIGYLSGLRFANSVRGIGLLARGFRFLKQLHDRDPDPPAFYLTTIAADNDEAKSVLTRCRAGLPTYQPIGVYETFVIPTRSGMIARHRGQNMPSDGLTVERLSQQSAMEPWVRFVREAGRHRLFFPDYRMHDFDGESGTFFGLDADSIFILKRDNEILATGGVWDQTAFRQLVIQDLSARMKWVRPLVNGFARLTGGIRLPAIGETISAASACCLVIRDDDPGLARVLVSLLRRRCRCENLLIGCSETDPCSRVFADRSGLRYRTELYAVNWSDRPCAVDHHSGRPFYLELGCL